MIIEKLKVKNYKSLEDVEIPLCPLTVFVGPNNSGKSNIFDCLEFVRDLASIGPPAVGGRNGFRDIVWGGDLKRAVEIRVEGQIRDGKGRQQSVAYEIGISGGETAYTIEKEICTLHKDTAETKVWERTGDRQWVAWSEEEPGQQTGAWGSADQRLGIGMVRGSQDPHHRIVASFAAYVEDWRFYRFQPQYMGSPGAARKEAQLLERGDNLASMLISIQTEDRKTFVEIEGYLNAAVPEIEEFSVGLTEDNRAFFRWREKGLPPDFRVKSWMSSDGTRQILGLLVLRFAPRLPPLLCIEEPDNFIHPGLLELVADLLRSISSRTQLLVSTHSPYLLNHLSPEDLMIVEKEEGKTHCKPLKGKKGVRDALKVLGLGELWYSGAVGGVP